MATGNDFFAAAPIAPAVDPDNESIDLFAQAIAGRFNNTEKALLTARLSPSYVPTPSAHKFSISLSQPPPIPSPTTPRVRAPAPSLRAAGQQPTASSSSAALEFTVATAASLPDILRTPNVLVLDIRPHSAYSTSRIPHAISLSVPSTLLKRPAFTLQKLTAMLPSASARSRFQSWSKASRIVAYDADSSTLSDGSNLLGLLRKFRAAGYTGDIAWIQGGIQALWRDHRHLVDEKSLSEDEDEEAEGPEVLRTSNLPQAAFQQSTTTQRSSSKPMVLPSKGFSQSVQKAQPKGGPSMSLKAANPFYDNIRQNMELSQGITERIPLRLSPTIASRGKELPFSWLRSIVASAGQDEGTEALAMQFYRIELGEQRRMQGIMAHHSIHSGVSDASTVNSGMNEGGQTNVPFPFSIEAGVEKGSKNRYRNIWPFEHSRVRLRSQDHDDYINASFVQPLGTRRQFIATQGPLPSTFSDFWSVVWEQEVHVILMLTKECEGGSIKCGKYWTDGQYGPYRLKCTQTSGAKEEEDPGGSGLGASGGVFFNVPPQGGASVTSDEDKESNFTIRRVFELSHTAYPDVKPRTLTHLQYLGWPDMDVPVNPRSLLRLMFEVDNLVDQIPSQIGLPIKKSSPVLLHCSAGVGRTGAFIMIDAVLDGVRREIQKRAMLKKASLALGGASEDSSSGSSGEGQSDSDDAMDIDPTSYTRDRGLVSTLPASTSTGSIPSMPSKSTTVPPTPIPGKTEERQVTHTQAGPVATLQMGSDKSGRADIHIPMVPSNEVPIQRQALQSSWAAEPFQHRSPASDATLGPSSGNSKASSTSTSSLLSRRMAKPIVHKLLTSNFTIADADSMFMSSNPNPAFAMDVESLQPQSQQAINNSSSSGEGNASGADRVTGSASSGSASDGRATGPLQRAFANMSSADDVPGRIGRIDSPRLRHRVGGGDGTGSGEGATGSASESSTRSSHGGGSVHSGYSSASSLGLKGFAGLAVASPAPETVSPVSSVPVTPFANRSGHQSPRKLHMQKPSLLAPKPLHLKQPMPELTEGVEASVHSTPVPLPKMKTNGHRSNASVRSNMSSSSTISSSTDTCNSLRTSITSVNTPDTCVTPPSTYRSPSSEEEKTTGSNAFDYMIPRYLHSEDSPPALSSLEEPLRQILEDMREQRMSLCQSLRQYVFVHNAIIEGALLIVDEERKRLGLEGFDLFDLESPPASSSPKTYLTGKRGASPTELTKKDKKGEIALVKRPSVKRGQSRSSGESTGS